MAHVRPSDGEGCNKRPLSPHNSPPPQRRCSTGLAERSGPPTPQSPSPVYVKELLSFNGNDQFIEASPVGGNELGGTGGLTVVARVRRTKDCGPAWDRLIDFGNGAKKENIVINFQREMMYEVRGEHGECQSLAVHAYDPMDEEDLHDTFPQDQWMHVSLVHGSDGMASIYWNGRLKARGMVHLPRKLRREKYYVGRSHWSDDPYFQGDIAELHVFDYALSDIEVGMCAAQRSLPCAVTNRSRPLVSLADSWREVQSPINRHLPAAPRDLPFVTLVPSASAIIPRGSSARPCGQWGCGGLGRCSRSGGAPMTTASLHYNVQLEGEHRMRALSQLHFALDQHGHQILKLEGLREIMRHSGATREVERIGTQIANSRDALRRAQAVSRMIRYATRLPRGTREDGTTGQKRQPPKIAAAVDPVTGVYQGFAIYELRSGDLSHGCRFHVYITDLFNMRMLLPFGTCWSRHSVGSLIVSLLQRKSDADHEVVVLRALEGDSELEAHYSNIGFSSRQQSFEAEGLADSFRCGDLLLS